ncbi:MAG: hypothetical protein ACOYME_14420 [Prochlorotrichaceae cyanobacterium]|jgi:hypothetical protein
MNEVARHVLRSTYRKRPLTGILLTAGLVDAVIGGANDRPDLFTFALILIGVALTLRWIRWQGILVSHLHRSNEVKN